MSSETGEQKASIETVFPKDPSGQMPACGSRRSEWEGLRSCPLSPPTPPPAGAGTPRGSCQRWDRRARLTCAPSPQHSSPSEHGLDLLDSTELNLEVSVPTQAAEGRGRGAACLWEELAGNPCAGAVGGKRGHRPWPALSAALGSSGVAVGRG